MRGAVIEFAGDYAIMVNETPSEVEAMVRRALESGTPLLHFTTRSDGEKVAVNPAQICVICEQPDFSRPYG